MRVAELRAEWTRASRIGRRCPRRSPPQGRVSWTAFVNSPVAGQRRASRGGLVVCLRASGNEDRENEFLRPRGRGARSRGAVGANCPRGSRGGGEVRWGSQLD